MYKRQTTPSGNIIKVFEGDHLGNNDARIVKILPDKIILSKLGSEVNLYFSKSRRVVLENNDGFRDNILADEYFDPPLIAIKGGSKYSSANILSLKPSLFSKTTLLDLLKYKFTSLPNFDKIILSGRILTILASLLPR